MILGVLIARMVAEDGESNWLEGLMLLMVYAILAMAFFFLPERVARQGRAGRCRVGAAVERLLPTVQGRALAQVVRTTSLVRIRTTGAFRPLRAPSSRSAM